MNYTESGVDVDFAEYLLKTLNSRLKINDSILKVNDYCSCIDLSKLNYKDPILTFSTDGVGSKLLLAEKYLDFPSNVAQDLFAMVFNDIICSGSKPLYMLDYYATHSLKERKLYDNRFDKLLFDLVDLCNMYNVGLVGGETAELPLLYDVNKFDFVGFGVGIVERENLIHKDKVKSGDIVIGIESSGPHSNGFTLLNKLIDKLVGKDYVLRASLEPTAIYIKDILSLVEDVDVHGIAHITGGGFNNISRVIPQNLYAEIDLNSWDQPDVFWHIKDMANLTQLEMLKIFNCGVGMVVIVDKNDKDKAIEVLNQYHFAFPIGEIKEKSKDNSVVFVGL